MSRSVPVPACPIDEEHLAGLADVLLAGVPLKSGDPAQLVRVRTATDDLADDEMELGLRAFEPGAHPLEVLVRFDAPDDWAAIGVIATGRAWHLDGGPPFPVRTVHLVARSGAWSSSCDVVEDGPSEPGRSSGTGIDGLTPAGRIDDALRRALGVPTAPPPGGTERLWAAQWLDAVVERAALHASSRGRPQSFAEVCAVHPATDAFDLDPDTLALADLVAEAGRLATWRDWPQLRRACAAGLWTNDEVDPATAAWLDDGAFARWVLAGLPELDDLRRAAAALLAPSILAAIEEALDEWGLLTEST